VPAQRRHRARRKAAALWSGLPGAALDGYLTGRPEPDLSTASSTASTGARAPRRKKLLDTVGFYDRKGSSGGRRSRAACARGSRSRAAFSIAQGACSTSDHRLDPQTAPRSGVSGELHRRRRSPSSSTTHKWTSRKLRPIAMHRPGRIRARHAENLKSRCRQGSRADRHRGTIPKAITGD